MSKQTAIIPLSKVSKIQLYINAGKKSLAAIMAETGADYGMNGGLFSGSKSLCNVKADGKVVNDPGWTEYGYAWNTGPDISMDIIPNSKKNYIGCVQLKAGKAPAYQPDMGGKRGRTAMGLAGSNLVLYCTGDGTADASTPEDLHTELLQKFQCDSALMLDGGGSSQCDFKGKKITASRVVANLILVYLKKEGDKPVSDKKKVVPFCLSICCRKAVAASWAACLPASSPRALASAHCCLYSFSRSSGFLFVAICVSPLMLLAGLLQGRHPRF